MIPSPLLLETLAILLSENKSMKNASSEIPKRLTNGTYCFVLLERGGLPHIPEEMCDDDDDSFIINKYELPSSKHAPLLSSEHYLQRYRQKTKDSKQNVKVVAMFLLVALYSLNTAYNTWLIQQFTIFGSLELSKVRGSALIQPTITATTTLLDETKITVSHLLDHKSDTLTSIREYCLKTYNISIPTSDNTSFVVPETEQMLQHLEFAYTSVEEMLHRRHRFPSATERVKIYMSNWYVPPCDDDAKILYEYVQVDDSVSNYTGVVARIEELSLQRQQDLVIDNEKQNHREQRVFDIFHSTDTINSFDEVYSIDRDFFLNGRHQYQKDIVEFFLPSLDRHLHNLTGTDQAIPVLYQFGDLQQSRAKQVQQNKTRYTYLPVRNPRIPIIQKVRTSMSSKELKALTDTVNCYSNTERRGLVSEMTHTNAYNRVHLEPIILKLKTQRHYSGVYKVAEQDTIPWEEKKNMAVFRGALTGLYPDTIDKDRLEILSVHERCRLIPRCWVTYRHSLSTLIDSKLTAPEFDNEAVSLGLALEKDRMIPRRVKLTEEDADEEDINAPIVDLFGDRMSMDELLRYKALIMLEGNDISSGLKWALFSNSVVMMPEPAVTSWAMEEKLQAWVHYVPINIYKDYRRKGVTDIEEKMQWILSNEEKVKKIVRASTLWIADLVLHPDVKHDEDMIFDEIARRYIQHFHRI